MLKKTLLLTLFLSSLLFNTSGLFAATSVLVDVSWLIKNYSSANIRVIDMSDDTQYQRFHIPGAIHLPYSAINYSTKAGISYSIGRENLVKILGLLGISNRHHVIIYDDMGGLNASRLFWEMEKIGHKNISILDGGLVSWILSGKKVDAHPVTTAPLQYIPLRKNGRNNLVDFNSIRKPGFSDVLLDVRSQEEYQGDPRYPRSGHIPGAKSLEWSEAINFDNAFKFKSDSTLRKQLKNLGIDNPDTPITVYCHSGHRAAHSYFTLRHLGFTHVKLYDGSMAEYSGEKSAPLHKGSRP